MSGNIEQENSDRLKGLQGGSAKSSSDSASSSWSNSAPANASPAPGEKPAPVAPAPMLMPQFMGANAQPLNGKGTAALVLGIIGMIPFPITGFWCSLLAIIFGVQGRRRARSGLASNHVMATWGMWLGIVGMGIQALLSIGIAFS